MAKWPKDNQAALIAYYGNPGSGSMAGKLVKVVPPFRMTYAGTPLTHLMFHKLAAPALQRALDTVWEYYGRDQKKIDALGISKTAGTYNPRKIRGSATKWSNHAYGAAIDINAEQNGFHVPGNIPLPMIAAFKAEGARWGGDYKGRKDPMHFEFCESGEPVRTFDQWLQHYGVTVTVTVIDNGATPSPVQSKPIVKNKPKSNAAPAVVVTSIVVAGGGAVAHQASKPESDWSSIAFIVGAVIVAAILAFVIVRHLRKDKPA